MTTTPLTADRIEQLRKGLTRQDAHDNVWLDEITTPEELLALLSMLEATLLVVGAATAEAYDAIRAKNAFQAEQIKWLREAHINALEQLGDCIEGEGGDARSVKEALKEASHD